MASQSLACQTPLSGVFAAFAWTHKNSDGSLQCRGTLWLELGALDRCFFSCTYYPDAGADVAIISHSGWHGRNNVIQSAGPLRPRVFKLERFRYSGMAAQWHHDMWIEYSKKSKVLTNRSCSCRQRNGHRGITLVPLEGDVMPAPPDLDAPASHVPEGGASALFPSSVQQAVAASSSQVAPPPEPRLVDEEDLLHDYEVIPVE